MRAIRFDAMTELAARAGSGATSAAVGLTSDAAQTALVVRRAVGALRSALTLAPEVGVVALEPRGEAAARVAPVVRIDAARCARVLQYTRRADGDGNARALVGGADVGAFCEATETLLAMLAASPACVAASPMRRATPRQRSAAASPSDMDRRSPPGELRARAPRGHAPHPRSVAACSLEGEFFYVPLHFTRILLTI